MTGSDDRSLLRTFIAAELPETRIFINRLYREFTASGRRSHVARIIQQSCMLGRTPAHRSCRLGCERTWFPLPKKFR